MERNYTDEQHVLIVISLLKKHGIKKIFASPGTTNLTFVRSVQIDSYFEVFSAVDERSAAYMACGLAAESGETVVLSCTGATASRNYLPGLTEAFYRKLPVLAITSTREISRYGHNEDQVIDRTVMPKDVAKLSVSIPVIKDDNDKWECQIKANQAILELKRHGGGPVHINLPTVYIRSFTSKKLPSVNVINRFETADELPNIECEKVAVFIGSHKTFTPKEVLSIEKFCKSNNAVVICDHTSNYNGEYKVLGPLLSLQGHFNIESFIPEVLIHVGEISAEYQRYIGQPKEVWRVSEDGEIRDTFRKLKYVFEMPIFEFFSYYTDDNNECSFYKQWATKIDDCRKKIPTLPFSNVWVAEQLAHRIPVNSTIHLGILNSLSSWNFYEFDRSVKSYCNVGGFGIDGCLSSLIGASLFKSSELYFAVIGDLAFFYDMNSLGNRHIGKNLRVMVVNNGKGLEFKIKNNPGVQFGHETDEFIAAAGHFGRKSIDLVRHYAEDLGFEYISASNKQEFQEVYERFITPEITDKPIFFEIFTTDEDEDNAQKLMRQIEVSAQAKTKLIAKKILGDGGVKALKQIIK